MYVVVPKPFTLMNSNVAEDTSPLWDAAATYNAEDIVRVEGLSPNGITKLYKSLIDSNTGNYPPEHPDKWQDLGATNKWKMFDQRVYTQTENADSIEITVQAPYSNVLFLGNLEARYVDVLVSDSDGNEVFSRTYSLLRNTSMTWSDYFFNETYYRPHLAVELPVLTSAYTVLVKIYGFSTVKCGMCFFGRARKLGCTVFNTSLGILDYSKKEVDEFGEPYISKGKYAKRAEADVEIMTANLPIVQKALEDLRATLCLWNLNNSGLDFENMLIYGFYKDFNIIIQTPVVSRCTITIEGVI